MGKFTGFLERRKAGSRVDLYTFSVGQLLISVSRAPELFKSFLRFIYIYTAKWDRIQCVILQNICLIAEWQVRWFFAGRLTEDG